MPDASLPTPPPANTAGPAGPRRARVSRRTRLALTIGGGALVLLVAAAATIFALTRPPAAEPAAPSPSATTAPEPTPAEPAVPEAIHVVAMGDMLPHDSVNQNAQTADGGWDYGRFFGGVQSQLDAADVVFCNQEVPSAGVEFGVSGYPVFNAPIEFAQQLRSPVGCDLVNLANNHAADKGVAGIQATRAVWDGLGPAIVNGVNRSAEEQRTVPVFEVDGVRVALVSFAEYSNIAIDGVSLNFMGDDALVTDLLAQARASADVVVVSAHWGTEDSHEVNAAQQAFAQRVADLGADVVLGTGPHVLQPVTWLGRADGGRTLVWYSLGNMLNTQIALDQRTGVLAGFDIVRDEEGGPVRVENPTALITYMHYDWSAEDESAYNLLARTNLSITPLAGADELLARTRFGVTAEQQLAATAAILGPDVQIVAVD